jgi:two-component system, sensor histidine kinase and response regulator
MEKNRILIVDDQPNNLKVISSILSKQYKLFVANSGEKALKILEVEMPDLILLDVMMPNMDGYQVCEILKQDERTKDIPIIFLTAKNELEDIVKGFDLGAVDYITKPFKIREVEVRIKNHIRLENAKIELRDLNAEKDKFFSIIAHDLKSPFGALIGMLELMSKNFEIFTEEELKETSKELYSSAQGVYKLLENLLEWSRIQRKTISFNPVHSNIYLIANNIVQILNMQAKNKSILLVNELPENLTAYSDENMVSTILRNLVSNAIKFTRPQGQVRITSEVKDGYVCISVTDNGIGMKEDDMSKLFRIDVHHTTKGTSDEKGTGLGLILCKEFVEINGGQISLESKQGEGTTFTFSLPLRKAE